MRWRAVAEANQPACRLSPGVNTLKRETPATLSIDKTRLAGLIAWMSSRIAAPKTSEGRNWVHLCPCSPNRASQSIHSPTDLGASFPCNLLSIAGWTRDCGAFSRRPEVGGSSSKLCVSKLPSACLLRLRPDITFFALEHASVIKVLVPSLPCFTYGHIPPTEPEANGVDTVQFLKSANEPLTANH